MSERASAIEKTLQWLLVDQFGKGMTDRKVAVVLRLVHHHGLHPSEIASVFGVSQSFIYAVATGSACRLPGVAYPRISTRKPNDRRFSRKGQTGPRAKLNPTKVRQLREAYDAGGTQVLPPLAARFGVSPQAAYAAATRRTWRDLPDAGQLGEEML